MSRHTRSLTARRRDAGLRRLKVANRVLIGAAVVFTGLLSDVAANAFAGHKRRVVAAPATSGAVPATPARSARRHGRHHTHHHHALRRPAHAPTRRPATTPTTNAAPAPAPSTAAPQPAAPAPQAAPQAAPAPVPAPAPVVSGGS